MVRSGIILTVAVDVMSFPRKNAEIPLPRCKGIHPTPGNSF
jgi:hypothetical protein